MAYVGCAGCDHAQNVCRASSLARMICMGCAHRQSFGKYASGLVSRVLSRATIYLERMSPRVSSTQPERTEGRPYSVPICACSRWGFPSCAVTNTLVRSYHTVSAFLLIGEFSFLWHLSVGSPRPAVSWHLALWSPDFPHAYKRAIAWPTRNVLF